MMHGLAEAEAARGKLREQLKQLHDQVRRMVQVQSQLVGAVQGHGQGQGQGAWYGGASIQGFGSMQSLSAIPAVTNRLGFSPRAAATAAAAAAAVANGSPGVGSPSGSGRKRRRVTPQSVEPGSPAAMPQRHFVAAGSSTSTSRSLQPGTPGWEAGLLARAAKEAGGRAGGSGMGTGAGCRAETGSPPSAKSGSPRKRAGGSSSSSSISSGRGGGVGGASGEGALNGHVRGVGPRGQQLGNAGQSSRGSPHRRSPLSNGRRSGSPSLMLLGTGGAGGSGGRGVGGDQGVLP